MSYGFVARALKQTRTAEHIFASYDGEQGYASWSDRACFVSSRPFRATPEADRERQPIVTRSAILAYAGRVENRGEIINVLGRTLESATDGHLLAEAYATWGRIFPRKVIGEYCFALIDRHDGTLIAGRDALGATKLYYYEDSEAVWVASTLNALVNALPAERPLDRQAIVAYLSCGGWMRSGTIYQGIRHVPPAHVLIQDGQSSLVERYWEPDPDHRVVLRRPEEYDEILRCLLRDTVRSALRSNGPICSDVSGGLDSSTVTSVAARLKRDGEAGDNELLAFTRIAPDTAASDESAFQNAMRAAYPLRSLVLDEDRYRYFDVLDTDHLVAPSTGIFGGSAARAQEVLFKSEGIRVQLTGLGGDPVFCGDRFPPLHLSEWLLTFQWASWGRGVREWLRLGDRSLWNLCWQCSRGALPNIASDGWRSALLGWWTPSFRTELMQYEHETTKTAKNARLYSSAAREYQYHHITQMQPGSSPRVRDWDVRHPLLSRPLVEFMLAISWDEKITPHEDRVIQRRAMKGILPESIRTRKDKGDHTPLILKGVRENWSLIKPFTSGEHLASVGIVETASFREACERLRHGRIYTPDLTEGPLLLAALSLEVWLALREQRERRPGEAKHLCPPDSADHTPPDVVRASERVPAT